MTLYQGAWIKELSAVTDYSSNLINFIFHTPLLHLIKLNQKFYRFLKSKVAILQTELDAGKNLNDMLDKENGKSLKKIKKLTTQQEKTCSKIDTMEITLKTLQEKHAVAEQGLKVII